MTAETVAVLGASPNPSRYAFRAVQRLRDHGHRPIPINPAFNEVLSERCYPRIGAVPDKIDTVTLYLRKSRSDPLIDDIIGVKPRRIIMNPGAENEDLAEKARNSGIEVVMDCTLVMLASGTF